MVAIDELLSRFRQFGADQHSRSPLTAGLSMRIADTPAIAELLRAAPETQQLPVLLLAAVHSIVLAEPDSELARWYPTIHPEPRTDDPFPAFERLCRSRADDVRRIVATRFTQTNEVGRSALFLPALGLLHDEVGPLAIVDVGTSAGLNLRLDEFGYRYDPAGSVGLPSPVTIDIATRGHVPVPARLPELAARVGLDQAPVDLADDDARRWLLACVWPDQRDRFERLSAAIDVARSRPSPIVTGDAVDDLAPLLHAARASGHPVVLNSWVLNYLAEKRQRAYVDVLDAFGAEHDLSWIAAESPAMCPGLPFLDRPQPELTNLELTRWRGGRRAIEHLGVAHPHGYWLHWSAGG